MFDDIRHLFPGHVAVANGAFGRDFFEINAAGGVRFTVTADAVLEEGGVDWVGGGRSGADRLASGLVGAGPKGTGKQRGRSTGEW